MFRFVTSFVALVTLATGQGCLSNWTLYNGHCYKHFLNTSSRVNYDVGQERCRQLGGWLTDIRDIGELLFLGNLIRTPGKFAWPDIPLVGLYKTGKDNVVNVIDGSTPYVNWCKYAQINEPNNAAGIEHCIMLLVDTVTVPGYVAEIAAPSSPCLLDLRCDGRDLGLDGFSRYVCKTKQIVCEKPNTEVVNGTCLCKKDYIDITETDVPEKHKYKPGEKCISKHPCKDVKDLTVNFLVDSSESIGADNWDSLVSFLKSGADLLPNTSRVGFVKFSNNVTFAKFLTSGWSKSEFLKFVPSSFDKGETNTAAAFEKATTMFKKDGNKNKAAVLITDGLPFNGELDQDVMQKKTKSAAKKLRSSGVSLIALGYGKDLDKNKIRVIQSWLEDPEEDYFEYNKNACDLKSVHMCLLMRKVCRRFVNY